MCESNLIVHKYTSFNNSISSENLHINSSGFHTWSLNNHSKYIRTMKLLYSCFFKIILVTLQYIFGSNSIKLSKNLRSLYGDDLISLSPSSWKNSINLSNHNGSISSFGNVSKNSNCHLFFWTNFLLHIKL